jgi:hypothetical protein
MSKPASWAITVTISYQNGITQQATLSDDCMTTLREVSAILERSRRLAEAMKASEPAIEEAAPAWRPSVVHG